MFTSCLVGSTRALSLCRWKSVHQQKGAAAAFKISSLEGQEFFGGAGRKTAADAQKTCKHPNSILHPPGPSSSALTSTVVTDPPPPCMFSPPVLHPPLLFPLTALNRGLTVWAGGGRVGGARGSAAGSVLREGFHEVPQQHPWNHWGAVVFMGTVWFFATVESNTKKTPAK